MQRDLTIRKRQELNIASMGAKLFTSLSPDGRRIIYQSDTELKIFRYLEDTLVREFNRSNKISSFWVSDERCILLFSSRVTFSGVSGHVFIYNAELNSINLVDSIFNDSMQPLNIDNNWVFVVKSNYQEFAIANIDKVNKKMITLHYRKSNLTYVRTTSKTIELPDSVLLEDKTFSICWNKFLPSYTLLFRNNTNGFEQLIFNYQRSTYKWVSRNTNLELRFLFSNTLGFSLTSKTNNIFFKKITADDNSRLVIFDTVTEAFINTGIELPNRADLVCYLEDYSRYLFYTFEDSTSLFIVDLVTKQTKEIEDYIERRETNSFSEVTKNNIAVALAEEDPISIGLVVSGPPLNATNSYTYFNAASVFGIELDVLEWDVKDDQGNGVDFEVVSTTMIRLIHPEPTLLELKAKFVLDDRNEGLANREFRVVNNTIIKAPPAINSLGCGVMINMVATIEGNEASHTIEWIQTAGQPVEIINGNSLSMTFVRPTAGGFGLDDEFYNFRMYLDRGTIAEKYIDIEISGEPGDKFGLSCTDIKSNKKVYNTVLLSDIVRVEIDALDDKDQAIVSYSTQSNSRGWMGVTIVEYTISGEENILVTDTRVKRNGSVKINKSSNVKIYDTFKIDGEYKTFSKGFIYNYKIPHGVLEDSVLPRKNTLEEALVETDRMYLLSLGGASLKTAPAHLHRVIIERITLQEHSDMFGVRSSNITLSTTSVLSRVNYVPVFINTIPDRIVNISLCDVEMKNKFTINRIEYGRVEVGV